MSWDDMDQAPGDLATVLADEFAVWFQNLGAQGILPRAFTGVTKDGKQGIVILTGLPFGHVQRRDFLIWLCRTEQFVAYAYGTHVGKIDSPSTFTFTEEVNIHASSHRYDVTKMLGIDKLADGTFRIFERDHSVMPASSKNGIFLGLQPQQGRSRAPTRSNSASSGKIQRRQ